MAEQNTIQEPTPARAMVIVSHPDDAEFGCAGTVARWAAAGCEITYVLGTSGDKGSDDIEMSSTRLVEMREAEQLEACRILGVKHVEFLRYPDSELTPSLELRKVLARLIRQHRPAAVICQDPTARWHGQGYIQHPDHIAMGEAALAATFPTARDRLTFPDLLAEGLEPHKVQEVYIMAAREADHWIDITNFFDTKIAALCAHASQVGDWDPERMLRRWAADTAAAARRHAFPGSEEMQLAESFKYFRLG